MTIEDETGDVQLILWPKVFARCRRGVGEPCTSGPEHGVSVGTALPTWLYQTWSA